MIVFDSKSKKQLIDLFEQKRMGIEGNILKLIDVEGDEKFAEYIQNSVEKDKDNRKKRLEITKQIQIQNKELPYITLSLIMKNVYFLGPSHSLS